MIDLLAEVGSPFVALDGPETVLAGWDIVLTVALTTVLGSLWRQGQENEKLKKLVSVVAPKYTGKVRNVVNYIDEISDGWNDAEIAQTAQFLSEKATKLAAGKS